MLGSVENKNVMQLFSLKGKTAIVTGGTRGIGLEAAYALAEAGADVAITYSTTKNAEEIAARLAADTHVRCQAFHANVAKKESIESAIEAAYKAFGQLDIVVANAGIASHVDAIDYTEEQFSEIMKVNLDGAFYTAQAAAKIFKKQGYGNIIFTASVSAILVNIPQRQAAYNASKAGLVQLARCLAVEWVDFCRVNCVSPGFIETDMLSVHPEEWKKVWFSLIPAQRVAKPYELKGAFVYLASDASSYTTGIQLVVDGAYTLP